MRVVVAIGISLLLSACAVLQKPTLVDLKPMATSQLLENPFGHGESIDEFRKSMPQGTKIQKLIKRSPRAHHRPDTIYNFNYKKSKISIYKTQFNQEFLLGGVVKNPQIELTNGIRQGMTRDRFFESFTDLSPSAMDTIVLKHPKMDRTFKFYFTKRGRLERFSFTGQK